MASTQYPKSPILIVDDEEPILLAIDTTLRMAGFDNVMTCNDSRLVMDLLSRGSIEIVLLDLTMPNVDGQTILSLITRDFSEIPVIIVTGTVDVDMAVACMKSGAFDYVVKPVEEDRLLAAVQRAISFRDLKRENFALKQHILSETLEQPEAFQEIVTNNKKMLSIFQYIESIARTNQPVLIRGETGVGKELVAHTLHALSGLKGHFVSVNLAGLDDNMFSDTIFGHVRGAYTGADTHRPGLIEQAAGGTLFLDEIGDLSQSSQVKLLRLLEEGEYYPLGRDEPQRSSARILASTHRNLWQLQKEGTFRQDLNYRLRTHRIYIPPLRERTDDIPLLVEHFLSEAARSLSRSVPTVPPELYTLLKTYHYPGNVRELKAMIIDAVSRHKGGVLSLEVFREHIKAHMDRERDTPVRPNVPDSSSQAPITFSVKLPTIKEATSLLVQEAMQRADGNQSIAAGMLGISQQALSKRLKQQA